MELLTAMQWAKRRPRGKMTTVLRSKSRTRTNVKRLDDTISWPIRGCSVFKALLVAIGEDRVSSCP